MAHTTMLNAMLERALRDQIATDRSTVPRNYLNA